MKSKPEVFALPKTGRICVALTLCSLCLTTRFLYDICRTECQRAKIQPFLISKKRIVFHINTTNSERRVNTAFFDQESFLKFEI